MAGVDIFNPNELQIFEEARERRLRDLHWPLLDQVAERENTLEEVQMVIDVARGDVQHASNLPGPAFEAIAAPIEKRSQRAVDFVGQENCLHRDAGRHSGISRGHTG